MKGEGEDQGEEDQDSESDGDDEGEGFGAGVVAGAAEGEQQSAEVHGMRISREAKRLMLLPLTRAGLRMLVTLLQIDRHVVFGSDCQHVRMIQSVWRRKKAYWYLRHYRYLVALCHSMQRKLRIRRQVRRLHAEGRSMYHHKCASRITWAIFRYRIRRYCRRVMAMGARIISMRKARQA